MWNLSSFFKLVKNEAENKMINLYVYNFMLMFCRSKLIPVQTYLHYVHVYSFHKSMFSEFRFCFYIA